MSAAQGSTVGWDRTITEPIRIKNREIRKIHSNMAADSKHSVIQLAPTLCENQSNNLQKKGKASQKYLQLIVKIKVILYFSGTGRYSWQAELQATRDYRTINDILERRSTEVRRLYEQSQASGGFILYSAKILCLVWRQWIWNSTAQNTKSDLSRKLCNIKQG